MSFTVGEIIQKSKKLIENNPEIGGYISIRGEIGTFKIYGKHAYLNLKEESNILKCVFFMIPSDLAETIKEGSVIESFGYLSIYEQRGEFQFYIKSAREVSKIGLLQKRFEELKQRLISQNVIPRKEEERRILPEFPEKIGIVTSRNGAALHDILKTFEKRYPEVYLKLFHTGVQGEVENEIFHAIENAERSDVDLIIIARGGGSIEDLWCFNNEKVVKKVRECQKPIIAGIGHETDHTLTEYAADYIASTPTAAAMISTPNIYDYIYSKFELVKKADTLLGRKINDIQIRLYSLNKSILLKDPEYDLRQKKKRLNELIQKFEMIVENKLNSIKVRFFKLNDITRYTSVDAKIERVTSKMLVLKEKIKANNPDNFLKLGYSRVEKEGITLNSVVQLKNDDKIKVFLKDGDFEAEVKTIKEY